jgi:hypothetical protein
MIDQGAIEKRAQRMRQDGFATDLAVLLRSFNALASAFTAPGRHNDGGDPHFLIVSVTRHNFLRCVELRYPLPRRKTRGLSRKLVEIWS